ncbi:MAG: phosphate/phosphite/phosphonate ABC transporter substrate-binding protein [Gammaproteobacteria bacterium]|nr:phosphate/phosphite/phosphonate ABC transporter substrate-binding protein [Gammaproteobacteria bacterium]
MLCSHDFWYSPGDTVHFLARMALSLLLGFLPGLAPAADAAPLRFGVFPRWNAQIMVADFTPLAQALGKALERKVQIETDKDFASFMQRVYAREFDLIHVNQLQYLQAHDQAGYQVIAKLCETADCTIRAVIVARTDTAVHSVADLRGKTVAFGGRDAMVSHILARELLRQHGLPPTDYRAVFAKNPPNALFTVYNGAAAAAGVGSPVFERPEIKRRVDVNQLRILVESDPIPPLPIAVRGDLDSGLLKRLRAALLDLNRGSEGTALLTRLGATHLAAAEHADYARLARLVDTQTHAAP